MKKYIDTKDLIIYNGSWDGVLLECPKYSIPYRFKTLQDALTYAYEFCANTLSLETMLQLTKLYTEHKELKI